MSASFVPHPGAVLFALAAGCTWIPSGPLDGVDPDTGASDCSATWYTDADADGYGDPASALEACEAPTDAISAAGDCDDADPAIHPGADEPSCSDPIDYNCDGSTVYEDLDADGWAACTECDDAARAVNPDAVEVCDGVDNDCSGTVDDDALDTLTWYADLDGDGFGDEPVEACAAPVGHVALGGDCDDADAGANPGAQEVCDSGDIDENCDEVSDDSTSADAATWYLDADDDGYGGAMTARACDAPSGYVELGADCDDLDPALNPAAQELCDDVDDDEDCDGAADDADADVDLTSAPVWYPDADGDGYGDADDSGVSACDAPSAASTTDATDCDDTDASVAPGAADSPYDGVDSDCAGDSDFDADRDGYEPTTAGGLDCDDADAAVNPGAVEVCDVVDNDCDGSVDDEDSGLDTTTASPWYPDDDGDAWGDDASTVYACVQPSGTVSLPGDCDDTTTLVSPSVAEDCNGYDDDCDGVADDGTGPYECPCSVQSASGAEDHPYLYCYGSNKTWYEAQTLCASVDYRLVIINDATEDAWVAATGTALLPGEEWFIGLYKSGGSWLWYGGGAASYTNWYPGQPDGQDCGMVASYAADQWIDDNCMASTQYICETTR